jgi:acyl-coenzyme A synthetase/AMP-(fatty) acid ligase
MRYLIVVIALNKLGYKALFSAPRNSLPMHLHLLNMTDCRTILHARQIDVSSMVGTHEAVRHGIPELSELLWANDEPPHYPFTKTFEEAKNDPYLVLHTSGSTGFPKPIVETHGYAAVMDALMHCPPVNGTQVKATLVCAPARSVNVFPPWHVAGSTILGLGSSIWGDRVFVWPPPDRFATPKDVMDAVGYANCTQILSGPMLFADIISNPKWSKILQEKIDYVMYGGGKSPIESQSPL